ncbi:MAG: sigma-70 family RNA polymerase sigma factor [Candidatus Hydrogenedentes bacterium]|nr:sigma-70 family RNA polymerase sigma factor [Candidatus Hydrogenedentota bacterium]
MMEQSIHNEQELLAAAVHGDRKAFGQLVRLYQRRAYAAAYSLVGNRDDALELSQDAFVKAFKAMKRFDLSMPFYPWLHRIIRNTSLNYLKKKKRRGESSLDHMMESGFDAHDPGHSPADSATRGELLDRIKDAMEELSPEQQEILRLRHFMELSYGEIATALNIPQGTVMSRLHGARKKLRAVMEARNQEATAV